MASPRRGGEVRARGACQYADRWSAVAHCGAIFDRYVLALNETGFLQTIAERGYIKCKAALAALDLVARERSLALSGALELGDDHRLVKLTDCVECLSWPARRRLRHSDKAGFEIIVGLDAPPWPRWRQTTEAGFVAAIQRRARLKDQERVR